MADPTRLIPQTGAGSVFAARIQDELTGLWNRSVCELTDVAGTGNAITADLVPALNAGLIGGMSFWLKPVANNTGAVTISINGAAVIDIVNVDGNPLASGAIVTGRKYLLVAEGGDLRVVTSSATSNYNKRAYLSSATWTKPDGLIKVRVRVRAGGGGGGAKLSNGAGSDNVGGGGGGGGEAVVEILAAALASTVAITIGSGGTGGPLGTGATGGTGGTSSFGVHAIATGGTGGTGVEAGTSSVSNGGVGGVGTAGDLLMRGERGASGGQVDGLPFRVWLGFGGSSPTGGAGGATPTVDNTSNPGLANSGGGGSGGRRGGTSQTIGAVGGSGYVEVEEFF